MTKNDRELLESITTKLDFLIKLNEQNNVNWHELQLENRQLSDASDILHCLLMTVCK